LFEVKAGVDLEKEWTTKIKPALVEEKKLLDKIHKQK
jgi:hypothetical protein